MFIECFIAQVASTLAVQALAPSIKELQNKHANDPERLQLETARLYKEANVNPLAGCLPTLATIPVFIGLYRCTLPCLPRLTLQLIPVRASVPV